ncbi:uncharacterized protein LOC142173423 [Nicotiana tabacum]|uniref:Uncharacterized protein LOC142173423 n=1 Tax=Nicotiana tabacum TaxID=4097 RepID=A0AC58TD13_TOBAC
MVSICKKLQDLRHELKDLNHYMASYAQRLNQTRKTIEVVQATILTQQFYQSLFDQEKELLAEIDKWSNIEEQAIRQKSMANWIMCGDTNSMYFHSQWKIRQSKNTITSICTNTEVIKKGPVLNMDQKIALEQPVTIKEIDIAIKDMLVDNAPGIDRYPIRLFCKKLGLNEEGGVRTENQEGDWQYNKALTVCFIEGENIIDNMLFSHELLKGYNRKGISPRYVMKVDLRKAYDTIDKIFLGRMLSDLGFPFKFIE